jgi:hypothetical protein
MEPMATLCLTQRHLFACTPSSGKTVVRQSRKED